MKKTLKNLTIVGALTAAAMGGVLAGGAYTSYAQEIAVQNEISTNAYTGDIDTPEGLTIVDQDINVQIDDGDGSTSTDNMKYYTARLTVNISTYETANDKMSNGYDIDIKINMPDTYTYNAGDESKFGATITSGTRTGGVYHLSFIRDGVTNDFILETDDATSVNVMDILKTNTSFTITIYNDPTSKAQFSPSNAAVQADWEDYTPGSDGLTSWLPDNTSVVFTETFQLAELDSTVEYDSYTPYYSNMQVTPVDSTNTEVTDSTTQKVAGYNISYDIHTNGIDESNFNTDPVTGDFDSYGQLTIPFTIDMGDKEIAYSYVINMSGEGKFRNFAYDDGTNGDEVANDGIYHIEIVRDIDGDGTIEAGLEEDGYLSLADAQAAILDPHAMSVDGDNADTLNYKPTYSYYYDADTSDNDVDTQDLTEVTTDTWTTFDIQYENATFIPAIQVKPSDENGVAYATDNDASYTQGQFAYSWMIIGTEEQVMDFTAPTPYSGMGPWAITGIVIGSIAGAALIAGVGYYYYTQSKAKKTPIK